MNCVFCKQYNRLLGIVLRKELNQISYLDDNKKLVIEYTGGEHYKIDAIHLWGETGKARFNNLYINDEVYTKDISQEEYDKESKIVNDTWQKNYDNFMKKKEEYELTHTFLPIEKCPNYSKELGRFIPGNK